MYLFTFEKMKSAPLFLHSDLVDTDRSADQASSLDGDVHHVQDGENSCDDLKSISDSESKLLFSLFGYLVYDICYLSSY